jgi:ABC-type branched-subunit amino acid transport system substrate-binding protein
VAVVAAVALVACSSSSKGGSKTKDAASSSGLSGAPINLVMPLEETGAGSLGDGFNGVQAAIKYINAHGGINGRPLAAQTCVDQNNANTAAACANKAVRNKNIIATIDQSTQEGASVDPILENAGMAAVGALPFTAADFSSPIIFAPSAGGLEGLGAAAAITDQLHGKKVGLVYAQNPAGATVTGLVNQAVLGPRGSKVQNSVGVPETSADLSTQAKKANEGSPDGIILYLGQAQANSFVKAAGQLGINTPMLISSAIETSKSVSQQLGANAKKVFFFNYFHNGGKFYDAFLSQWSAAGESASDADDFAINGWLAATMFADVARKLPTVTRASVLGAFKALTNYDTGGLTPTLSFATPGTALGGKAPRIVNPTITLTQFQDGKFVPYQGGPFINPFVVP